MGNNADNTGSRMGMWIFLYTEIMFFGGLFILYAAYYHRYTADFVAAGRVPDLFLGTLNTALLIISSFAVAASVAAMRKNSRKLVMILLAVTVVLGSVFLFNKYVEWSHDFARGYYPGSESMAGVPAGRSIFFALYFTMTGLHAVHVIIGIGALVACIIFTFRRGITGERMNILENSGLFWHLVDIIWIFLFPLFYLLL